MAESTDPLVAFSDHVSSVPQAASSVCMAMADCPQDIHWRSGVIVRAEEVLDRGENIKITLPGGRLVEASLAGRDPSTDAQCSASSRHRSDGGPDHRRGVASPAPPVKVIPG